MINFCCWAAFQRFYFTSRSLVRDWEETMHFIEGFDQKPGFAELDSGSNITMSYETELNNVTPYYGTVYPINIVLT